MRTIGSSGGRILGVLAVLAALGDVGAALPTTRIQDVLFNADGTRVEGSVTIRWREFTASDGSTLAANLINVRIVQGLLRVDLTPNEDATPDGTSYQVTYLLDNGTRSFETWIVPESGSAVTVSQIRAIQPPPSGLVIAQSQVSGLVAALDGKAGLHQENVFSETQTVQETSPGSPDAMLSFLEAAGTNSVGFRLPTLSNSALYTLPVSDGLPGNQLSTDGAGNLFWADQGSGSGPGIAYEIFQNTGASVAQRNVANFSNGLTAFDNVGQTRTEIQPVFGSTAGTITQGNDPRLSDARAPLAHSSTHASAGSDPITPASIGALANTNGTITTTSPSLTPLSVTGVASQTAPLQTWRDSTGALLALVSPGGSTFARQMGINSEVGGTVANLIMQVDGANRFAFSAFDTTLNLGRYDDEGVFKDVAVQILREGDILLNSSVVVKDPTASTGASKFTIQAGEGQGTTALQEWKDNAANILTSIDASGNFQLNGNYLALAEQTAPATPSADQARLFLDAASGEVSVRKDSGSVVSLESSPPGAGITTLNTLTAATQTFAVGATGTDFGISSAGSTHTLSLPPASATSSGKLSSADWSSFDSKQPGDSDLTALAGLSTTGLVARTGSGTAAARSVTGTANEVLVTNADGVSGNPAISIAETFDLSGKTSTKPIKSGTTLPATCAAGEYFFDTNATAGRNTYACTAANTWTLQGDGGGGATNLDDLADVDAPSPSTNEVLKWNGSEWAPGADNSGTGSDQYCTQAGIRCAHLFSGANAGAKIAAAISNMKSANSRGGVIDARGLTDSTMGAFTVQPGITVLLPARQFSQTGIITVNQDAELHGATGESLSSGTQLVVGTGLAHSIRVVNSGGCVKDSNWAHKVRISRLHIDLTGSSANTDGISVCQPGENFTIEYVQTRTAPRYGFNFDEGSGGPSNFAGAGVLRQIEPNGSGVAGIHFRNNSAEFLIDGLSGDCNASMFLIEEQDFHTFSLVVEYTKSESVGGSCPGTNDPWMHIRNFDADNSNDTVMPITILGGRHTQNSGGATDWILSEGHTAGSGPIINVINEFVQGTTNLIRDVENGVTITVAEVASGKNSKIPFFQYDGHDGNPESVHYIGRGLLQMRPTDARPTCDGNRDFSLYPDASEGVFCYCDGSSWKKMHDNTTCN